VSILARIRAKGGDVTVKGGRTAIVRGNLTDADLAWLRDNRERLLAETVPSYDQWSERAAILEYDAGIPRAEAEARAWAEVEA